MESARAKIYTKHISAVVTPDDYEFLKKTAESYSIGLGDVLRGIIKNSKDQVTEKMRDEKRQKQPRLF